MISKWTNNCLKILLPLPFILFLTIQTRAQTQTRDSLPNERYKIKQIAYGVKSDWKVTGSQSSLKGKKLQQSFTSNLAMSLPGRLSGLTVTQNGNEPGLETPGLFVRGVGTFGAGREPLILVDGFEGKLETLTPYEVESITVLKDATATALYGSRAANGVIMVTTKRGEKGRLIVNFNAQGGFHQATRMPKFLNSYQYAKLYNEALTNNGQSIKYEEDDLEAYKTGSDPYFHPNVNWYDQVLRKASPIMNYDLNFSGGNEQVRYFAMLNVITDQNLLIKSGDLSEESKNGSYNRYNFRANVDANLTKSISAHLTLAGSVEDKTNPIGNNTSSLFNTLALIPPNAFPIRNPDGSWGGSALYSNPFADVMETGSFSSNGRTLQSTLRLDDRLDNITKGLSTSAAISFNNFFRNFSNKTREYERYAISKDVIGDTLYNGFGQNTSLEGQEGSNTQWRQYSFQAFINYDRTFNQHGINAMLMYHIDNYSAYSDQFPFKHVGVGSRLTYTNNDKYIGEFSLSYMGSGNFAKGKRLGFFPAVSGGWIVSKENFMTESQVIKYLKLRASYGLVGNDDIGGDRFMFDATYNYPTGYNFGTSNSSSGGLEEGRAANPNVTWEKDKKFNIGIDLDLLNLLSVSLDVFKNYRYDILVTPDANLPAIFGMNPPPLLNEGVVDNRGFEASISYKSKEANKFKYQLQAKFWYAKNEVIYMSEAPKSFDYERQTGYPVGQSFALQAIGLFNDAMDIASSPVQTFTPVQPGDLKYKDQNGDGLIDASDYVASGNTDLPELTLGLNADLNYGGWDLKVFFQAVEGRTIYLNGLYYEAFQNKGKASTMALERWTPQTAESATYPRLSSKDNLNNFKYSTFWMVNGSFLKLRSIEFGYNFENSLINKIGINKLRLFINGTNLSSLDHLKYKYSDPETLSGYPAMRTVSMGINVQF